MSLYPNHLNFYVNKKLLRHAKQLNCFGLNYNNVHQSPSHTIRLGNTCLSHTHVPSLATLTPFHVLLPLFCVDES